MKKAHSLDTDMQRLFIQRGHRRFLPILRKKLLNGQTPENEIPASGAIIMPRNAVTTGTINRS